MVNCKICQWKHSTICYLGFNVYKVKKYPVNGCDLYKGFIIINYLKIEKMEKIIEETRKEIKALKLKLDGVPDGGDPIIQMKIKKYLSILNLCTQISIM